MLEWRLPFLHLYIYHLWQEGKGVTLQERSRAIIDPRTGSRRSSEEKSAPPSPIARGLSFRVCRDETRVYIHVSLMTNVEDMEDPNTPTTSSSTRDRFARFMEDSCCTHFCLGPNPTMARYVYALLFLVTCLLAWTLRDYGHSALSELQRLKGCEGARYCLGTEGVLRVSLGGFIFFFVMFISTAGTKKLDDPRNSWHSEWWPAKIILWIVLMATPFSIPSAFIQLYGKIAHFGAGVFLVIQLISVISFITWLNECCRPEKNVERCRFQSSVLSIATQVASILGIILMYIWYTPKASCILNIFFITLTLVLLQLMNFVSSYPKVKGGLLAPGLMGLYIVYLCWCAIRSEPHTESCNKKAEPATTHDWLTIVSFVIGVLVIVMATFSTGVDSKSFQFKKKEAESEDDVPYAIGFFHFVFAMGAMYFGMLLIGWNAHSTMRKWTIDVGWASTWVKIISEWLAALVYTWMLVAPLVWKTESVEITIP